MNSGPFQSSQVRRQTEATQSSEHEVVLPAARALANMDREAVNDTFEDGIYVLHPLHRLTANDPKITADVVFIHGLAGGAFKTWRQRDIHTLPSAMPGFNSLFDDDALGMRRALQVQLEDETMTSKRQFYPGENNYMEDQTPSLQKQLWLKFLQATQGLVPEHTSCWPKDWLPLDCPFIRILSVDFEAEVSEWLQKCPGEPKKMTIAVRSNHLRQQLRKAGIGERPIIWITHSLGGLLVKKLLVQCSDSDDPKDYRIWNNTKGVVFFSVPHRGSLWADWGTTEKFVMPTAEVQELKSDSCQLLQLHNQFKEIAERVRLPILSFGETLKTKLGLRVEALFVTPYSSDPGIGEYISVATDHINVCKPVDKRSKLYLRVLEFIYENIPHSFMDTLWAPAIYKLDSDTFLDRYMMWQSKAQRGTKK